MRHTKSLLAALAIVVVVIGGYLVTAHVRSSSSGWHPSTAQMTLARQVAISEATSMNPADNSSDASPASQWPANVKTAIFAASTRQSAVTLTDASGAPDNRSVLVIQMTGTFRTTMMSVPQGVSPVITRSVVTLIIDATTGMVLDASLGDTAGKLDNAASLKTA